MADPDDSANQAPENVVTTIDTTNLQVLGNAPAQSMALVYQVLASSISLSMQNAQADFGGMLQIGTATVSVGVAGIVSYMPAKKD